jgi:hypothetical protein
MAPAEGVTLGRRYASLRDPGRNDLRTLHERLDVGVFELCGFSTEDYLLARLLALDESIAAEEEGGVTPPRGPGAAGLSGVRRTDSAIAPTLAG